jgi:cell division control protein 7
LLWCTSRNKKDGAGLSQEELEAVEFMKCCLELDPAKRITADEALQHPFLADVMEHSDDGY